MDNFSSLNDVLGSISTFLSIWSLVRGPEEVRATLASFFKYFLPSKRKKESEQVKDLSTEDISSIFDSTFDKLLKTELKSEAYQQPKKQWIDYLYILAVLVIIPILLVYLTSRPAFTPEPETVSPPIDWTSSGGMNILSLFWMFVCLFGIIGAMRGWAKELLVVFSIIVALAVTVLIIKYIPFLSDLPENNISLFWVRVIVITSLGYFGYQMLASIRVARERFTDSLFGAVIGGMNGYLIAGSILAYFHKAGYPYQNIIAPATDLNFLERVNQMMAFMPPNLIGEPGIYFAVIFLLILVLVVYI